MNDTTTNGVTTSVFTRHLEELEELQSGASSFEEAPVYSDDDLGGEPNLEWRRQLLEEANTRVKQAKARALDPAKVYDVGTLLFDATDGKFGRVVRSVPGFLVVVLLRGGEREYGRDPGAMEGDDAEPAPAPTRATASSSASVTKLRSKAPAPAKANVVAKPTASKPAPASSKKAPSKVAAAHGIDDVNGYIKANFQQWSNRELARRTGLSEHTIRRKLGEWGLKREKK